MILAIKTMSPGVNVAKKRSAEMLCISLLAAEAEDEVVDILNEYGVWSSSAYWREFGGNENNFSIIGNQQSSPVAAMVEKFVNSVDAVLMRECLLEGVAPDGANAPNSIATALERYFDVKDGNLANLHALTRSELARNIGFVATGRRQTPNYIVFDLGEGQTPAQMPNTLLSLAKSNKLRIPFVQGKFNMGGTGVLQFCGQRNFQLIISRRHPAIIENDASAPNWGFTIVRREDPGEGRRSSMFTYLAPDNRILSFPAPSLEIPVPNPGTENIPSLEWGTVIKLYEYEMTSFKTNILFDLYNQVSLLLPRVGLPIRFYERRGYSGHSLETTMSGLHVRLEEDKRDNVEDGFPTYDQFKVNGEPMSAAIYAFKKDSRGKYTKSEGVIFTVNGQTHGVLTQGFYARRAVGMSYLSDSILVIVNCDRISGRAREDLFMNSRDRLRGGELRSAIEHQLEEILRNHQGLRDLRERRRREEIESKISNARPLKEILNDLLTKSPTLSALFIKGIELSNPFRSRLVGEESEFQGKPHPSYFMIKSRDQDRKCHLNSRFRVQFETDVENEYFGRDQYPGSFSLKVGGESTDNYVINLWNGVATLTVELPSGAKVGDTLHYEWRLRDDVLIDPFRGSFTRDVREPRAATSGSGGRQPPAGSGKGDRQTPEGLAMPQVIEVREDDWVSQGFDRYSALKMIDSGEGSYDFYVNMDNVNLQTEIKASRIEDPRLFEARFKFALVLIGMALLRDEENGSDDDDETFTSPEARVQQITRAIAPILLPMIDTLGDLEVNDVPANVEYEA